MKKCSFVSVRNGYSCVPVALSEGLDIRLGTSVTDINYGGPGVTVKAVNQRSPNQAQTFKGKVIETSRFCFCLNHALYLTKD